MDEFASITPRVPDFLLDTTILTLTRFPRYRLGHVRDQLASLSPPDASFPQFSKLPAEIRLKIWRNALPGRRRIAINRTRLRDREYVKSYYEVYPYELSPAILFVCQESRELGLKLYTKLLTRVRGGLSGGVVYMDFEIDVLYLDDVSMTWAYKFPGIEHDLTNVKHLALRGRIAAFPRLATDQNGQPFYPAWLLEPFHSLETLFIDDRARHSLPTMSSILTGIPIDRTHTTVPAVSGIVGHVQWRFHHIWYALEQLAKNKAPGEKVVKRPNVTCRLSWEGIKDFDVEEYHRLRAAQFAKEDEIEESWLRYEREREELKKIVNLGAWSKMYVPLARLGL